MPTQQPRIQVTMNSDTNAMLAQFALRHECSLSAAAAKLIEEALELHEDAALSKLADARMKNATGWVSHDEAWK